MIQYIRNLEICSLSLSPSLSKLLSKFFEKKKVKIIQKNIHFSSRPSIFLNLSIGLSV